MTDTSEPGTFVSAEDVINWDTFRQSTVALAATAFPLQHVDWVRLGNKAQLPLIAQAIIPAAITLAVELGVLAKTRGLSISTQDPEDLVRIIVALVLAAASVGLLVPFLNKKNSESQKVKSEIDEHFAAQEKARKDLMRNSG